MFFSIEHCIHEDKENMEDLMIAMKSATQI